MMAVVTTPSKHKEGTPEQRWRDAYTAYTVAKEAADQAETALCDATAGAKRARRTLSAAYRRWHAAVREQQGQPRKDAEALVRRLAEEGDSIVFYSNLKFFRDHGESLCLIRTRSERVYRLPISGEEAFSIERRVRTRIAATVPRIQRSPQTDAAAWAAPEPEPDTLRIGRSGMVRRRGL